MCLIHRWEYKVIDSDGIETWCKETNKLYIEIFSTSFFYPKVIERICTKCYKKQYSKTGVGIYNFIVKEYVNWREDKATASELREYKLRKLLK